MYLEAKILYERPLERLKELRSKQAFYYHLIE